MVAVTHWPPGENPQQSIGKRTARCCVEHFVPFVAVTKQSATPTLERHCEVSTSCPRETLYSRREVEQTMLKLLEPFTGGTDR